MSAYRILGPDGRPLVVAPPRDRAPGNALEKSVKGVLVDASGRLIDGARVEQEWANEVQKRVRNQAITLAVADKDRGRDKPTPVTYATLRLMAARCEWVRAVLNIRKRQIGGKKWSITVRDEDPSGAAARMAKQLERLLRNPRMRGSQPESTSWRQFIGMYLEDLLVLDRSVVEKERDATGWIKALYNVDGATIRPNMDERGAYLRDAYVQMVQGQVTARFGMEELVVGIENPATDVNLVGYGMSPLETLVVSVTADLHAAKFNSEYFTKGAVPEGLLSLGEDVAPEDVDAFRMYWLNEIMGKPWALPIMGGSKAPEFLSWRESNRDMQFMEYQDWLLQKIAAVFCMSKKELGSIEDVNRSTAEDASSQDDEKGLQPLLAHVKEMVDLEIIGEHGQGLGDYLEFDFEQAGETADEINKKFQPMHSAGVATGKEWRDAHGMEPDGDPDATHGKEGLAMHLKSDGTPLPSKHDADQAGLVAQQQREDERAEQERAHAQVEGDRAHQRAKELESAKGGPAAATGWQPGDDRDPDLQTAMRDHDRASGVGPRNVGKTHDRHPALTGREDDLADVFASASQHLIASLVDVIGGQQ